MEPKDLLDEHVYDTERELELASKDSSAISRRQYFKQMTGGVAVAAISGLLPRRASAQEQRAIVKNAPTEYFIKSGSNLEMRWEAMYNRGYIVPTELFFVRNNSP